MESRTLAVAAVCGAALLVAGDGARGQAPVPPALSVDPAVSASVSTNVLSAEELDALVGPIALYPDPLIAQLLPASTYPLEIVQAARWLEQNPSLTGDALESELAKQPWAESVKALAKFKDVMQQMNSDLNWTLALGSAFLEQEDDVLAAIQRMRSLAYDKGLLRTTPEQTVRTETVPPAELAPAAPPAPPSSSAQTVIVPETRVVETVREVIYIEPSDPEVIYVPTYSPQIYYHDPVPSYDAFSLVFAFGAGVAVNHWFDNHCDWRHRSVHYYDDDYYDHIDWDDVDWDDVDWDDVDWDRVNWDNVRIDADDIYIDRSRTTVNKTVYKDVYKDVDKTVVQDRFNRLTPQQKRRLADRFRGRVKERSIDTVWKDRGQPSKKPWKLDPDERGLSQGQYRGPKRQGAGKGDRARGLEYQALPHGRQPMVVDQTLGDRERSERIRQGLKRRDDATKGPMPVTGPSQIATPDRPYRGPERTDVKPGWKPLPQAEGRNPQQQANAGGKKDRDVAKPTSDKKKDKSQAAQSQPAWKPTARPDGRPATPNAGRPGQGQGSGQVAKPSKPKKQATPQRTEWQVVRPEAKPNARPQAQARNPQPQYRPAPRPQAQARNPQPQARPAPRPQARPAQPQYRQAPQAQMRQGQGQGQGGGGGKKFQGGGGGGKQRQGSEMTGEGKGKKNK